MGIYHIGVASCLRQNAPHLLNGKVAGASAGAMVACLVLCDCPLGTLSAFRNACGAPSPAPDHIRRLRWMSLARAENQRRRERWRRATCLPAVSSPPPRAGFCGCVAD